MKTAIVVTAMFSALLLAAALQTPEEIGRIESEAYLPPSTNIGSATGAPPVGFLFGTAPESPASLARLAIQELRAKGHVVPDSARWAINVAFAKGRATCVVLFSDTEANAIYVVEFDEQRTAKAVRRQNVRGGGIRLPDNLKKLFPTNFLSR